MSKARDTAKYGNLVDDLIVTPLAYGAVGDGVTDDTAAIQAALTWVNQNLVNETSWDVRVRVDLGGKVYAITDTLNMPNTVRGIQLQNGTLVATGTGWTTDQPMVRVRSAQSSVERLAFDCGKVASGIKLEAGFVKAVRCTLFHFRSFGIYCPDVAGDSWVIACNISEWFMNDSEYHDQTNFIATGLLIENGDCKFMQNIVRWCGKCVWIKKGAGLLFGQSHFYNGNSPGNEHEVTAITNDSPAQVTTLDAHAMQVGWHCWIEGVSTMPELNLRRLVVREVIDAYNVTLEYVDGSPVDTTASGVFDGDGMLYGNGFKDTIAIQVEAAVGSVMFDGCYMDNGQLIFRNSNISVTNCQFLAAPTKTINDRVITKYANAVDDKEIATNISMPTFLSRRITTGDVQFLVYEDVAVDGTYSQSGTTITVTAPGHPFAELRSVYLTFTGGTAVTDRYGITAVTEDTFTVEADVPDTTSGAVLCEQYWSKDMSNLPNALRYVGTGVVSSNESMLFIGSLSDDATVPVAGFFSGNGSDNGAKIVFIDADTTLTDSSRYPFIRSSGDALRLRGEDFRFQNNDESSPGVFDRKALYFDADTGAFHPDYTRGTQSLGLAGALWSEVFAVTGTINTSDARDKEQIADLSVAEKRVAKACQGMIKKFKFKDAVAKKGAAARTHVGVMVQDVVDAFTAEGLDAMEYGIVCYDEWQDKYDDDGSLLLPAGNHYGVRMNELLAFIIGSV